MSTYQTVKVPRLRLESLDAVREKLGVEGLKCDSAHITGRERAVFLGEYIQKHIRSFKDNIERLDDARKNLSDDRLDAVAKSFGLYRALLEEQNSILRHVVENKMMERLSRNSLSKNKDFQLANIERDLVHPLRCEALLKDLTEAIKEAHTEICRTEQIILKEKTVESFKELGYRIKSKKNNGEYLIRGTKDLVSVAAQLTSDGEMNIDMGGFDGTSCKEELNKINNILLKKGIVIEIQDVKRHGKKEGGVLIQRVSKELQTEYTPTQFAREEKTKNKYLDRRKMFLQKKKLNRL